MFQTSALCKWSAAGLIALSGGMAHASVTISHDFSDGTAGPFTLTNTVDGNDWTFDEENERLEFARGTTDAYALAASTSVAGSAADDFSVSTVIRPHMDWGWGNLGLHARANAEDLGGEWDSAAAAASGYWARLTNTGGSDYRLRLMYGTTELSVAPLDPITWDDWPISHSGPVTWTFDGDVQGNGDLLLTTMLSHWDGQTNVTAEYLVASGDVASDGDHYGFRAIAFSQGLGNPTDGRIDQLSVTAVPEPATLTLGLLGLGAMMLRRRR